MRQALDTLEPACWESVPRPLGSLPWSKPGLTWQESRTSFPGTCS